MAEYLFTGAYPRIMFGLSQGVNAWHTPADGTPTQLVEGQTIVLNPGDRVRTADDIQHPDLEAPAPVAVVEETPEVPPAEPPAPTKPARNGTKA